MDLARYIGLPYADKGRGPDSFDCWGLVRLFYAEQFGIVLPSHLGDYESAKHQHEVSALIEREKQAGKWFEVPAPMFGDLVSMRIAGQPWHVGIALGDGRMLHTMKRHESVIESHTSRLWAKRIDGYFRHVAASA